RRAQPNPKGLSRPTLCLDSFMTKFISRVATLAIFATALPSLAEDQTLDESIRARADASWEQAMKIWEWAEVGYHETRSAALLAETLEAAGFRVERGPAGIPTAFIATAGRGKPVIAILGEYDALPGLSQSNVPERKPRAGVSAGHGCGHPFSASPRLRPVSRL